MARILAVVGHICVGKTTLIDQLNEHLSWDRLCIDDSHDWDCLTAKVHRLRRPTIIESVAMPAIYRTALKQHDTTIMLIICDPDERQRRLVKRGETRPSGRDYTRSNTHFRIDTTHGVTDDILFAIATMARTRYARQPILPVLATGS